MIGTCQPQLKQEVKAEGVKGAEYAQEVANQTKGYNKEREDRKKRLEKRSQEGNKAKGNKRQEGAMIIALWRSSGRSASKDFSRKERSELPTCRYY